MGTILITVVRGDRRRDLAVRGDVPIADLLGPLADALVHDPGGADRSGEPRGPATPPLALARGSGPRLPPLALAPVCGGSLPPERSLEACGVGHGAVLVLLG